MTAPSPATGPGRVLVGVLVFDGCDLLDVGGPYEAILTADRLQARRGGTPRLEVVTIAAGPPPLVAYGGLGLTPTTTADAVEHLDVLVVPGTIEVDAALDDTALIGLVGDLATRAGLVTSVCTGSFLLAAAGVLRGRTATTHHEDLPALAARDDVGTVVGDVRFVGDDEVVTAGALSSGLALGLHLVERLAGRELAMATADQLAYEHHPDGRWVR